MRQIEVCPFHGAKALAAPLALVVRRRVDHVSQFTSVFLLTEMAPDDDIRSCDRPFLLIDDFAPERLLGRQQLDGGPSRDPGVPGVVLRERIALLNVTVGPGVETEGILKLPLRQVEPNHAVAVRSAERLLEVN